MILVRKPKDINSKHLPGYKVNVFGAIDTIHNAQCVCVFFTKICQKSVLTSLKEKRRDPYKIRLIKTTHFFVASFQPLLKSSQMFSSFYSPVVVNIIWIV